MFTDHYATANSQIWAIDDGIFPNKLSKRNPRVPCFVARSTEWGPNRFNESSGGFHLFNLLLHTSAAFFLLYKDSVALCSNLSLSTCDPNKFNVTHLGTALTTSSIHSPVAPSAAFLFWLSLSFSMTSRVSAICFSSSAIWQENKCYCFCFFIIVKLITFKI